MARRPYAERLERRLQQSSDADVRGRVFDLPSEALRQPQPLFRHQLRVLNRFEQNGALSGILHLPTGAGKTRIALEIVARRLREDRNARIVWASYPRILIRQGMTRLAELAGLFPKGTKFQWAASNDLDEDLLERAHVTFLMRDHLTALLGDAGDGRSTLAPLKRVLDGHRRKPPRRVTLIYDECHQLGAKGLQEAWWTFSEKYSVDDIRDRLTVVGLSATPLPTNPESHALLQEQVFPVSGGRTAKRDWGVFVHDSLENTQLEAEGILCPLNLAIQDSGAFEIPEHLLHRAGADRLQLPGRTPGKQDLLRFSERFNRSVMSDDAVIEFLASRVGSNLKTLGKTLVFAPTIDAANKLSQALKRDPRVGNGRVSLVHSRLDEFAEGDDEAVEDDDLDFLEVSKHIEAFRHKGAEPCVMVNVGMLTTGFDDPKILSIILARLTFSTNLFWQMIGRGTRGPKCGEGGTPFCNVIDPVHLTDRFSFLEGYRPKLDSTDGYAKLDRQDLGEGALDPRVRTIRRASIAPGDRPAISSQLRRDLAEALRAFLDGGRLDSSVAGHVALQTSVGADGIVRSEFVASDHQGGRLASIDRSNAWMPDIAIRNLEVDLRERNPNTSLDLSWIQGIVPVKIGSAQLDWLRSKLDMILKHNILTEEQYLRTDMGISA